MFGIEGERGGIDRIENDSVDRIDGDGAKKASTVVRSEHKTTMMMEFSAVRESKDPKIGKLDLPGVAKCLIHYAQQNALDTHNQLQLLANSTTDNRTKESYISCSKYYDKALYSFDEALKDLKVNNPDYLNIEITAARQNANDCKTLDLKDVFKPDPKLIMKIDFLENVCGILLSISDILPKY
ncbi:putative pectinesterase inhibitor domain-containing protein [Arabidopsis thaliana]